MKKLPVVQPRLFSFQCPENVGAMPEASGGHYCGRCEKVVLDLGEATLPEAVATIRGAKKGTCVSYGVATDGRLLFKDRSRGAVAITVAAFLAACHGQPADSAQGNLEPNHATLEGTTVGKIAPAEPVGPEFSPPERLAGAPPVENYEVPEPTTPPAKWPSASDEPPRDPPPPVAPPSPPRPTHPRPHLRGRVATPPPRPQHIAGEIPVPPPAPEPWSGTIAHPDD